MAAAVQLATREWGTDEPVVLILHGMLGSSRNWQAVAKVLAEGYRLVALDARNHGDSPWAETMSYEEMVADTLAVADRMGQESFHLVGHSMGGKTAMLLACGHGRRVRSLTVVDMAPRAYAPRWKKEYALLRGLPVGELSSRAEAEALLEPEIRDWGFRQFLLSNLERDPGGGFRWRVNLQVLENSLPNLFEQIPPEGSGTYDGPTLFLRGEKSGFVSEEDEPMMRRFFPDCELETVGGAGHNVHFDRKDVFAERVRRHWAEAEG